MNPERPQDLASESEEPKMTTRGPRGAKGNPGDKGDKGNKGNQGNQGLTGDTGLSNGSWLEHHVFLRTWASVAVVAIIVLSIGFNLYEHFKPKPYAPLIFPLRETVANRVSGISTPAIHVGEALKLTVLACSRELRSIEVRAMIDYRQIQPPGPSIPFTDPRNDGATYFDLPFPGGCTSSVVSLPTDLITKASKSLFAKGLKSVTWQLEGTIKAHHSNAVSEIFQSENFMVVP